MLSTSGRLWDKITPSGTLTTLYNFCSEPDCTDGSAPYAGLMQGTDGDFYGTTSSGGANTNWEYCRSGCGTVFRISPSGALKTLYSFCAQSACSDGLVPIGGLLQATNGDFYGTTSGGGAKGGGTVFKITPAGKLTTLYTFDSASGVNPQAGLIQALDGDFYGTTFNGGAEGCCHGTVFKITPGGVLTVLHSFCSESHCADGENPYAGLVQATDGSFYGATTIGGAKGGGTVFKITPTGTLTTLYSFCSQSNCADGNQPWAGLVQGTDGDFYGTTYFGGATIYGCPSDNGCAPSSACP
jgi:uncharacterized repeat protein (TIGR03803 family)